MANQEQTKEIKTLKTPPEPKRRKRIFRKILSNLVLVFVVLALIGSASGFIYIKKVLEQAPVIELDKITSKEGSKIFFEDGTFLASLAAFERENITFDELSHDVIDAFLAIEDARFFSHNGFDLPRFSRAFLNNLRRRDLGEGASTFSMQLVDNAYESFFSDMIYTPFYEVVESEGLSRDSFQYKVERLKLNVRKINAKILEIGMAIELEKMISKQQIIEHYLNKIYFGAGTTRGIQNAALYFFNKSASDISLVEAAFLAGVINAPSAYNPWSNLEKAKKRTNDVLYQMKYHGYLSDLEYQLALKVNLEDLLVDPSSMGIFTKDKYITVVNTVVEEAKALGYNPFGTPMHIYTSIRKNVQDTIEDIEEGKTMVEFPNELMESASVVIENNTGRIVGIGGGRKTALLGYNRATEGNFQPASAVKPILSYALAYEYLGWSTSHVIEDRPSYYSGTNIVIGNSDGRYRGEVLITEALAQSYNLPAYLTLEEIHSKIGAGKIREYLRSVGFRESTVNSYNLQFAIGGSNFMVSPVELAGAHSVLYSGGNYTKPHIIDKIDLNEGEPYEANYVKTQVISPEAAYLVSRLTLEAVNNSIGGYMTLLKRSHPIFGKTGTSDYGTAGRPYGIPTGAGKEKWMVVANSQYTIGVWIGFDKPVRGKTTYLTNAYNRMNITGKMSRVILDAVEKGKRKPTDIKRPANVVSIQHIIGTFPYASPVENMDPKYIVSGLIRKENAILTNLVDDTVIDDITEFNVTEGATTAETQNLSFSFAQYPGKIGIDDTYDLMLGSSKRGTGRRLFLPSWIYGGVNYKVDIYDESDHLMQTLNFLEPNGQATIDIVPGHNLKVCGYYGYQSGEKRGGQICHNIEIEDESVVIPEFTSTAEVDAFITLYNLTNWQYETVPSPTFPLLGTLAGAYRNSTRINNMTISMSNLNLATRVRKYGDWQIKLPENKNLQEVTTWGNNIGVSIDPGVIVDPEVIVASFDISGTNYSGGTLVDMSSLVDVVARS